MKCYNRFGKLDRVRPAPHGAGGLKSTGGTVGAITTASRPARGGWIEIYRVQVGAFANRVPPRTGRVD